VGGAKALAKALDGGSLRLRELNLQNNRAINNDGAVAFMRAIEHNQHMTKLWLSGTQVRTTVHDKARAKRHAGLYHSTRTSRAH